MLTVSWSPLVLAPSKTIEVADTAVFTVITFAFVVRALIPEIVSVPVPSPRVHIAGVRNIDVQAV